MKGKRKRQRENAAAAAAQASGNGKKNTAAGTGTGTGNGTGLRPGLCAGAGLILAVSAFFAACGDPGALPAVRFLVFLTAAAAAGRQIIPLGRLKLPDGGYAVSLGFGAALVFLAAWYPAACGAVPYGTPVCLSALAAVTAAGCAAAYFRNRKTGKSIGALLCGKETAGFVLGAGVFAVLFAAAFWIKGFRPEAYGTEKMMDFGFMQSMYRQQQVPPEDMWFSGTLLNYYYLGQAAAVCFTRCAFTVPEYGYNFMLCALFSVTVLGAYSVTHGLVSAYEAEKHEETGRAARLGGTVSALSAAVCGNAHWIIYGMIIPAVQKITGLTLQSKKYWFPDSTRFIGYNPDVPDKTIHEFPSYSFVLGDLHAHVINLMFTLPLFAVLAAYAVSADREKELPEKGRALLTEVFSGTVAAAGILTGLYRGTNFWDFPIWFCFSGLVILAADSRMYGFCAGTVRNVLLKGAAVIGIGYAVSLPFTLKFVKMSASAAFAERHSALWQMAVLWGVPAATALLLVIGFAREYRKEKASGKPGVFSGTRLFVTAAAVWAAVCVAVPETVYVKDIYGADYARCNTVFKFTYQAYVIFAAVTGFAAGWLAVKAARCGKGSRAGARRRRRTEILLGSLLVFVLLSSLYSVYAVKEWFGNISDPGQRSGISATAFLTENSDFEYDDGAVNALNLDSRKHITVIEGTGDSYTAVCKLSVFAGVCCPVGWHTHEWLWKNDLKAVDARTADIKTFYECGDPETCGKIAAKYGADYIFVGTSENSLYSVNTAGFKNLGVPVWESADGTRFLLKVTETEKN